MRIAMFTNNYKPYIGGVPISIEHLAQALRENGHQVYIFAPSYEGQEEEKDVIRYPSFPFSIVGAPVPNIFTKLFMEKVIELQIDVIHVHHPAIVGNVALAIKRKLGIPVVFTYHTKYEEYLHYIKGLKEIEKYTGIIDRYLQYFCKKCDLIIAPTPGIKEYLLEKDTQAPVETLPTGIPREAFEIKEDDAREIRQKYIGKADYLFCTVSRLAKEKNLYFQIDALAHLKHLMKKQGKTFCHLIIGDGPEKKKLQKRIDELGLTENVILLGYVENTQIKNYQAASDLFLFTSKTETQGIVLLEAMAASNPVIAVNASGVCDVVKNAENGYLTREDTHEWSEKIMDVLNNKIKLEVMQCGVRKTAEKYAEDVLAKQAELYYECVCKKIFMGSAEQISIFHPHMVR